MTNRRVHNLSPEITVRTSREAGEGAVAMTTGEEGLGLREAELSADLTRHRRPGGVLGAQEWRSQGVKANRGAQEGRSGAARRGKGYRAAGWRRV